MKSSKDNSVKVQDLLATKDWPYDEKNDSEGILNNRAHKRRVNEEQKVEKDDLWTYDGHDWRVDSVSGSTVSVRNIGNDTLKKIPVATLLKHGTKSSMRHLGSRFEGKNLQETRRFSIQQLATISDEALDKAYGYGRSSPGNTFGWQANIKSATYAKQMIDKGITDIEQISDAIHKGWNVTAKQFVTNPDQFDDTEKLKAAGKLEAKIQQRKKLMNIPYAQLSDEEKEKDRVVARALLQAHKLPISEGILNNTAHKRKVNESGAGYNALYAKMSDEELNKLAASKDPSKRMAIFQAKREIQRRKSLPPSKQMDPEDQMDLIRQARRQGKTLDQIRRGAY